MPAVTTELEWTTDHVLQFMLETGRFQNSNGTPADDRIEAAHAYLATDWEGFYQSRLAVKGLDPERPATKAEGNLLVMKLNSGSLSYRSIISSPQNSSLE